MADALVLMKDGMARPTGRDVLGWLNRGEVLMAVGVIGVIMLLILPIPKMLLDLLRCTPLLLTAFLRLHLSTARRRLHRRTKSMR